MFEESAHIFISAKEDYCHKMNDLPVAISQYLNRILYPNRAYAYLQLDEHHCVVDCGGELERCGAPSPERNSPIENQFDFLTGILPVDGIPAVVPNVELGDQIFIDMHIFKYDETQWVLLLDNSATKPILQAQQQARLSEKFEQESARIDCK